MPIIGRSLWDAAQQFSDHVNSILFRTLTQSRVQVVGTRRSPLVELAFRHGGAVARALLHTKVGQVWLSFGQTCDATTPRRDVYQLHTVKYKYALTPDGTEEPMLRWEYVRDTGGSAWCRHHLQGPVLVHVSEHHGHLNLNDHHLPTGYVPFEEVLRFCIVDLGVQPLTGDWDAVLRESYDRFRAELGAGPKGI